MGDKTNPNRFWLNFVNWLLVIVIGLAIFKLLGLTYSFSGDGAEFSFAAALKNFSAQKIFFQSADHQQKNILILGVPGPGNDAPDLTDTIMLASFDPVKTQPALFSFPRDLWVKIPKQNYYTKLNALYQMDKDELSLIKQKIEQISDLKVQNYLVLNLAAVKEIIEQVGGVEIDVAGDILDSRYPGPNHTFETFQLAKGWQKLDGQTAVKYMRTRHQDNDYGRMKRQQQIIKALAQKIISLNPLWHFPTYLNILNIVRQNIKTDLGVLELKNLWDMFYQTNPSNLAAFVFDAGQPQSLLYGSQIDLGQETAAVLLPKAGQENYSEIQKYIKNILNQ